MSGITEAYCVHIATHVTSHESVPKARTPKQCCYRRFNLESMKLPPAAITLEDDNKTVICSTHKQGPIIQKSQCVDGISVLDEGPLQHVLTHYGPRGATRNRVLEFPSLYLLPAECLHRPGKHCS